MEYLELSLLGAFIGLCSALIGVGGGVLIVPLLPLLFVVTQKETIATSLFTVFFVVLFNTIGFHKQRLVNWSVVAIITPAAALFAFISGKFSTGLNEKTLKIILAVMLVVLSLRVFVTKKPVKSNMSVAEGLKDSGLKLLGLGILAGLCTGFTGVGAGILLSPALLYLGVISHLHVSPTSNAIMVFSTLFGALGYVGGLSFHGTVWKLGFVRLDYAIILAFIAIFVAKFGRRWQQKLSFEQRKYALGSVLFLFACKEIYFLL